MLVILLKISVVNGILGQLLSFNGYKYLFAIFGDMDILNFAGALHTEGIAVIRGKRSIKFEGGKVRVSKSIFQTFQMCEMTEYNKLLFQDTI